MISDYWRKKYEEEFCKLTGTVGARAFGLGRHALATLLKALDINRGDKIGVCSFTCVAVIEAVKVCGAIPVYLDVDEHLCIDPQAILLHNNGSLKAVLLQHTFGNPGKFEQLLATCNQINATIIEDCAHSLGSLWNDKKLGKFGVGAIYSFQWGKPYTTGQGGMLTVNSGQLLDKVDRQIKESAAGASLKSEIILECRRKAFSLLGQTRLECYLRYNYSRLRNMLMAKRAPLLKDNFLSYSGYARLAGEMTAKAGLKQLENWHLLRQTRLQNTAMIEEYFSKAGLFLWPKQAQANVTMLRYPLLTLKKREILKKAERRGLDIAGWYASPVHPLYGDDLAKAGYRQGACVNAENMINRLIHLPTGTFLNKHRLETMMNIICKIMRGDL